MPGIADYFSAENVGSLMQDPRLLMGLQLLAQGRQGSSGQAIGQAGGRAVQMYGEQKRQQELGDYRRSMMEQQQQQMALQQQAAQAKAQQQAEYRARLQDPAFLASLSPMARQMAQLGVDPSELIRAQSADNLQAHRQAQLAQQQSQFDTRQANAGTGGGSSDPRSPAPRAFVDQPLGDDMYQRYQYDAASGGYQPWGKPFNKHSQRQTKDATGPEHMTDAILNGTAPSDEEPVPDVSSLPGTGNLQSYAPGLQQGPIGVMAAAGGNAQSVAQAKPNMRVPGQAQIARPTTKAEYDSLPAGAQYIDPVSGKTATKRG